MPERTRKMTAADKEKLGNRGKQIMTLAKQMRKDSPRVAWKELVSRAAKQYKGKSLSSKTTVRSRKGK